MELLGRHDAELTERLWLEQSEGIRLTPVTIEIQKGELPPGRRAFDDSHSCSGFIVQTPNVELDTGGHFTAFESPAYYVADACKQFGYGYPAPFLLGSIHYAVKTYILYYLEPASYWGGGYGLFAQVRYETKYYEPPRFVTEAVRDIVQQLSNSKDVPALLAQSYGDAIEEVIHVVPQQK